MTGCVMRSQHGTPAHHCSRKDAVTLSMCTLRQLAFSRQADIPFLNFRLKPLETRRDGPRKQAAGPMPPTSPSILESLDAGGGAPLGSHTCTYLHIKSQRPVLPQWMCSAACRAPWCTHRTRSTTMRRRLAAAHRIPAARFPRRRHHPSHAAHAAGTCASCCR